MANIHLPHDDVQVSSAHSGEYYDRCPTDGCVEVDRRFKFGGRDGKGEEHLHWSMFHADPRQGGCGATWTRTTAQGQARDHAKGVHTRYLTQSAQRARAYSLPSEAFRRGWEIAFGKKDA